MPLPLPSADSRAVVTGASQGIGEALAGELAARGHHLIVTARRREVLDDIGMECSLIVWNDEVNTFDWVIQALVEICDHTQEQAEQCAMIIHSQGKYAVKHGTYEVLKPMCDAITERGIGATVEALSGS